MITGLVIKINEKQEQYNPISMTKVTYPSGMKACVTSLGIYPRSCEVLAKVVRNTEWAAEYGSSKYHLRPCGYCRNENSNGYECFCCVLLIIHLYSYFYAL